MCIPQFPNGKNKHFKCLNALKKKGVVVTEGEAVRLLTIPATITQPSNPKNKDDDCNFEGLLVCLNMRCTFHWKPSL